MIQLAVVIVTCIVCSGLVADVINVKRGLTKREREKALETMMSWWLFLVFVVVFFALYGAIYL